MPSQRPFFLSTFFAAFRQQSPSTLSSGTQSAAANKQHTTQSSSSTNSSGAAASAPRTISSSAVGGGGSNPSGTPSGGSVMSQLPLHSPRPHHHHHHHHHHQTGTPGNPGAAGMATGSPIPIPQASRRRGSDSSSEGFRDVLGADKWYIGGRTAGGEEKFFKLGVVRRVRSGDRLSLDRLSL